MTVSSTVNRVSYAGNGVTVVFPYTFKIFAAVDLEVILRDAAGNETPQVLTTNYSVSGVGIDGGGNITMLIPPPNGSTLVARRNLSLTQGTDYVPNDPFPAQSHEDALDRLTMIAQQLNEAIGRAFTVPKTDSVSVVLPSSTQRANLFFAFDAAGNVLMRAGTTVTVPDISPYGATLVAAPDEASARAVLHAPGLLVANLFTALQTIQSAAAGAAIDNAIALYRNKGVAGAAADFLEALALDGLNALSVRKTFARLYAQITTATSGAEDGTLLFETIVAGANAARMALAKGLVIGAPTGGDKGLGSANLQSLFLNNRLLESAPRLIVADRKPSGTAGSALTVNTYTQRDVQTVLLNTIGAPAGVAANKVTLPAGTYDCWVSMGANMGSSWTSRARLFNATDGVVQADTSGKNIVSYSIQGPTNGVPYTFRGRFTLAAQKDLRIEHYTNAGSSTQGIVTNQTGQTEEEQFLLGEFQQVG